VYSAPRAAAVSAAEGAVIVGGARALAAALYGLGIKNDGVVRYEYDVTADHFLMMTHGTEAETAHAKDVLISAHAARVDVYSAEEMRCKRSSMNC
jgi:hypothetical protein